MKLHFRRSGLIALGSLCIVPFVACGLLDGRYHTPVDRSHAPKYLVNLDDDGLALEGYDPVAYFTEGKPVKGDVAHRARYQGATYQFVSPEHRRLFETDPEHYAPAFGGYCGYAASIDKVSPVDVELFQVIGGRLVLQHNEKAWRLWNDDVAGNLKRGDANWPGLVAENATLERVLVNVDDRGVALEGHDPVAYFTDGKPVLGKSDFTVIHDGAIYWFATAAHKHLFELEPAKYVPQFGGFCGYAASVDRVSPVNIELFQVIDGRLVLQHSEKAWSLWNDDVAGNLKRADSNWPGLVERKGS